MWRHPKLNKPNSAVIVLPALLDRLAYDINKHIEYKKNVNLDMHQTNSPKTIHAH